MQNKVIARFMHQFFDGLTSEDYSQPESLAAAYAAFLWNPKRSTIINERKISKSHFNVALGIEHGNLEDLTKRTVLISDTLLVSHGWQDKYNQVGLQLDGWQDYTKMNTIRDMIASTLNEYPVAQAAVAKRPPTDHIMNQYYGIHCPSLGALGQWIIDAEALLRAGLTWYLPAYSITEQDVSHGEPRAINAPERAQAIDYLIRDKRAIDVSGATPIKSKLVRPILSIDLPFIEGVNLREFSKITIEEFDSYTAFRNFLRRRLLDIDDALNSDQSERELVKIGLEVADEVRAVQATMRKLRMKRAVTSTGAVIGAVGAMLVAVHSHALDEALRILGASGGVWAFIQARTEYGRQSLRDGAPWYYVWTLSNKVA